MNKMYENMFFIWRGFNRELFKKIIPIQSKKEISPSLTQLAVIDIQSNNTNIKQPPTSCAPALTVKNYHQLPDGSAPHAAMNKALTT